MADAKISALPSATTPAGTEVLPLVQSGVTTKISINDATGITRPFTANGVVYASSTTAQATGSGLVFDGSLFAVGTSTPATFAKQTIQFEAGGGLTQALSLIAYSGGPTTTFRTVGGTPASPSATSTATINLIGSTTSDGTTFFNTSQILSNIDSVPTAGSHPTQISFSTTPSGSTSRVSRMNIASTGIITMSAYGVGTATFSATGVISSVSDETWKIKDGVPADPDSMLKKLEPGYWYYNDEKKESYGAERQLGFYAQNVNAAIGPEAAPEPTTSTNVDSDGNETTTTRPWGYYDRSVLAVTVMSLQKALATIESLTARIDALEAK